MVPFSCGRGAAAGGAAAGGAPAAGPGGAPAGGAAAAGAPGFGIVGAFIMSIVPLNLGAVAPFRLNPHFLQVVAASSFSVPQFGQNTQHLLDDAGEAAAYTSSRPILKRVGVVRLQRRCFCSALDTPLSGSLRFASPGGPPGKTST